MNEDLQNSINTAAQGNVVVLQHNAVQIKLFPSADAAMSAQQPLDAAVAWLSQPQPGVQFVTSVDATIVKVETAAVAPDEIYFTRLKDRLLTAYRDAGQDTTAFEQYYAANGGAVLAQWMSQNTPHFCAPVEMSVTPLAPPTPELPPMPGLTPEIPPVVDTGAFAEVDELDAQFNQLAEETLPEGEAQVNWEPAQGVDGLISYGEQSAQSVDPEQAVAEFQNTHPDVASAVAEEVDDVQPPADAPATDSGTPAASAVERETADLTSNLKVSKSKAVILKVLREHRTTPMSKAEIASHAEADGVKPTTVNTTMSQLVRDNMVIEMPKVKGEDVTYRAVESLPFYSQADVHLRVAQAVAEGETVSVTTQGGIITYTAWPTK